MSNKIHWHLIGNLQKNKAKTAVRLFDLIHSVDSAEIAEELNKQAGRKEKKQHILVQVKMSDETTKHGISQNGLFDLIKKINDMRNIDLKGLMVIPPYFSDPEQTRPYFRKLKQLADELSYKGFPVNELSMGMSNDFEVAVEEGATMLRIGSAIFGKRPERIKTV